jgi:hypothetical protein
MNGVSGRKEWAQTHAGELLADLNSSDGCIWPELPAGMPHVMPSQHDA